MAAPTTYRLHPDRHAEIQATLNRFPTRSPFIEALDRRISDRAASTSGLHLTKDDVRDLKDLGVRIPISNNEVCAPPSIKPSVERHLKAHAAAEAPKIPPRYFKGFTALNVLGCAGRAFLKAALIIPLGILAGGIGSYASVLSGNAAATAATGLLPTAWNAITTTFKSIGNFLSPVASGLASLSTASVITFGLIAVAIGVTYDGVKKRTARQAKVREDAGVKRDANPLSYKEDRIAKGFSLVRDHWKKFAFAAVSISFLATLASSGTLGGALKLTTGFALGALSSAGAIVSGLGAVFVGALFIYELMKLRYEQASAATASREKAKATAEAEAARILNEAAERARAAASASVSSAPGPAPAAAATSPAPASAPA